MPLSLDRTSPTTLVITRHFAAPPQSVWNAHMQPALIRQWLRGAGGTTMPICENHPRAGGAIHYEWREPDGSGFSLTGTYALIEAPHRSIHTEVMHLPDPTPPSRVETRFIAEGAGTKLVLTMTMPDAATMDGLIASGMQRGLEGCYALLDAMGAAA